MSTVAENNKRIARNTFLLYIRMLLIMSVSLYTVRVVLNTLGVVDYGIYNVVGGVVTMFAFLSGTMASASQRFFSFELGRNNQEQLKKTFSMTITIYAMVAVIILILAETVGLWFLNTKMTIPAERMDAARWIYQFSILSFMMTMFTIPYNASIIAHEEMKVYAYVSIIEVGLKLLIVYLLVLFSFDKLKLYAVLMFLVTTIVTFIYRTYCTRKFSECRFSFYWNKPLFKQIVSYSGWNLFGALAGMSNNQGINIMLNVFFGPIVNTARGIAYQVSSSVNQFVQNFVTATNPQIIKYYADDNKEQMLSLVFRSSKFAFILLFILSMPILLETNFVFTLWLKDVPEYVVLFTRLVIICALIDSLSFPLMTAAQATGRIKKYQSITGGMMLLNLPVSYIFLKIGYPPVTVFYIAIINSCVCLLIRLYLLQTMVGLQMKRYLANVILPLSVVILVSYIIPLFLKNKMDEGIIKFIVVAITGLVCSVACIFLFGLSAEERGYSMVLIKNLKSKIK